MFEHEENGTRVMLKKHTNSREIIERLFPNRNELIGFANRDNELRANIVEHYEKYFSYHLNRKIPKAEVYLLEKYIKNKNSRELREYIIELFNKEKYKKHKIFYKIENLVSVIEPEDRRNYFFKFIINNLDIIPESEKNIYGMDYRLRLIDIMAIRLNILYNYIGDKDGHSDLIISFGKNLGANMLWYFARKITNYPPVKQRLNKLMLEKVKGDSKSPFFLDPYKYSNRIIMKLWKENEPKDFDTFISKSLKDESAIKLLIRNFATIYDHSYFVGIEEKSYFLMKELFSLDFIFNKIGELNSEIISRVKLNEYKFEMENKTTIEESVEQFIYWYKKDNNLQ
ncbi:hypothetical protein UMM65_11505 [Aureibaculum sp. 2210JD6-5]|uniref:hypothetical protein n=1 Tax=Aureibaculum sp. 2210JD6-5 TaxID=3103957 RepID=UPI002AACD12E|nr:hypothetical protein [Aureibaculum sp. 2210JD6-5]MDY7395873.1 hypothetical protein [Aureibaculum sp. 2210JD6-5]